MSPATSVLGPMEYTERHWFFFRRKVSLNAGMIDVDCAGMWGTSVKISYPISELSSSIATLRSSSAVLIRCIGFITGIIGFSLILVLRAGSDGAMAYVFMANLSILILGCILSLYAVFKKWDFVEIRTKAGVPAVMIGSIGGKRSDFESFVASVRAALTSH